MLYKSFKGVKAKHLYKESFFKAFPIFEING